MTSIFPTIDLVISGGNEPVARIREAAFSGCILLRNVDEFLGFPVNFLDDSLMPEVHSLFDDDHLLRTGGMGTPGVRHRNLVRCDLRNCKCPGVHRSCWKPSAIVKQFLENLPSCSSFDIDSVLDQLSTRRPSHAELLDFDEREWHAVKAGESPMAELLAGYESGAILRFHNTVRGKLMPKIDQWLMSATGVDIPQCRQAHLCQFRLARYPDGKPVGTPGLAPHLDTSLWTLVFSDKMSALHLECDGRWIDVPPCSGVLLFGWAMSMLTGGRFRGAHHVVAPVAGQRASCIFFADLDLDRPLCLPGGQTAVWDELKVIKRCRQWRTRSRYRETLLHLAADHNLVLAARWARKQLGTPVDTRNWLQRTPLHQAALAGSCETAELLLEDGAELDAMDKYGLTPLHLAGVNGRHHAWSLLRERGADAGKTNRWGSSPTDWRHIGCIDIEEDNTLEDCWVREPEMV